jgi:sRNA-binding protein
MAGDILELLKARYPVLCAHPMKPLAIGTSDRLSECAAQLGLTRDDIQLAMIRHTRSRSYFASVAQGGARYNLAGEIEGEVDPSQAKAAQIIIDRRKMKEAADAARRRAERAAQKAAEEADPVAQEASPIRTPDLGEKKADEPRPAITAPAVENTDAGDKAA